MATSLAAVTADIEINIKWSDVYGSNDMRLAHDLLLPRGIVSGLQLAGMGGLHSINPQSRTAYIAVLGTEGLDPSAAILEYVAWIRKETRIRWLYLETTLNVSDSRISSVCREFRHLGCQSVRSPLGKVIPLHLYGSGP